MQFLPVPVRVPKLDRPAILLQHVVEHGTAVVQRVGKVHSAAVRESRTARGPAVAGKRFCGQATHARRHDAFGELQAVRTVGRWPLSRALVLGTVGHQNTVPEHDARGPIAPVVGCRRVQKRQTHRLVRTITTQQRYNRHGRLRDHIRPAYRFVGQKCRSLGAE